MGVAARAPARRLRIIFHEPNPLHILRILRRVSNAGCDLADMSHTAVVDLMLRIDVAGQPPRGEVVPQAGESVAFVGWLGLLRCLSDLVDSAGGEVAASGLHRELDPRGQAEL
jgi:hypothetical protein